MFILIKAVTRLMLVLVSVQMCFETQTEMKSIMNMKLLDKTIRH